jgi:hypothetical protein
MSSRGEFEQDAMHRTAKAINIQNANLFDIRTPDEICFPEHTSKNVPNKTG